jgi:hypothetical protein
VRRVDVDVHRTGPAGRGKGDDVSGVCGQGEPSGGLRDGCHQRWLVESLVRHAGMVGVGHAIGDQHHRLAVEQRLGRAVHGARSARAAGGDAHAGGAGELAHHAGHDGGGVLGVGEDELDAGVDGSTHHIEVRTAAGHSERVRGAGPRERIDQGMRQLPVGGLRAHVWLALIWKRYV